jgi:hypothetical protein
MPAVSATHGEIAAVLAAGSAMMDAQRQRDLWAIAVENYQAARLTAQQGWHNVSVERSYYAVYTAMWMAVDEPPSG